MIGAGKNSMILRQKFNDTSAKLNNPLLRAHLRITSMYIASGILMTLYANYNIVRLKRASFCWSTFKHNRFNK